MSAPRKVIPGLRTRAEAEESLEIFGTIKGMCEALGVSRHIGQQRLREFGIKWSTDHTTEQFRRPDVFQQVAIDERRAWVRAVTWPYRADDDRPPEGLLGPLGVAAISDLHTPEVCWPMLRAGFDAIERELAGPPDITVIIGDIAHADMLATFDTRTDETFAAIVDNMVPAMRYVLARTRHYVILVPGNHDDRLRKAMRRALKVSPGVFEDLQRQYGPTELLERADLAASEYDPVGGRFLAHRGPWVRLGNDVALTHYDNFSGIPMRTAAWVADMFACHESLYPGIRLLAVGHTHHLGQILYHDKTLVETGCLCWDSDYKLGRKIGPAKNEGWHRGAFSFRLLPGGSADVTSFKLHDLSEQFNALPGTVQSPIWEKPPAAAFAGAPRREKALQDVRTA